MVNSLPKHKVPTSCRSSRIYFCQGMVVVLNQLVFYFQFLEFFMFIRAKYVFQFSKRDDL